MARKLILLSLALGLGLAVTGVAGASWFNVIRGTRGDDVIAGTAGPDFVLSFAGIDQVTTGDGRDIVYAGKGNDTVDGGAQFDRLFGGPGNDRMHAVFPDNQVDTIDCGAGYDVAFLNKNEHDLTDDCEVIRYVTPRASANESADTDDR